mmetsp:Transcript_28030/g.68086  ORF Transcript_28030/g.68086 Transcript_28030/m.68086 type:complete len:97 (+) Transcript_28030:2204-2494(+)
MNSKKTYSHSSFMLITSELPQQSYGFIFRSVPSKVSQPYGTRRYLCFVILSADRSSSSLTMVHYYVRETNVLPKDLPSKMTFQHFQWGTMKMPPRK